MYVVSGAGNHGGNCIIITDMPPAIIGGATWSRYNNNLVVEILPSRRCVQTKTTTNSVLAVEIAGI